MCFIKEKKLKKEIEILSDFNVDNLHNLLSNEFSNKDYKLNKSNYGSFYEKSFRFIKSKNYKNTCIVWTQIEKISQSFNKLINYEKVNQRELKQEIKDYINILKQISKKSKNLIVMSWTLPNNEKGRYLRDFTDDSGVTKNLSIINLQIANELKNFKNIYFLNSEFIIGQNNYDYNPKYWYVAKIPFSLKVFELASKEIVKIINSLNGKNIKLIILDLDNTLWGGILGDLGWQKISIGGISANGEAFQDFQKKLKSLKNLGIQLAISSKNSEDVALEAIKKNKNMILKIKDFSSWRINWKDKASNVREIISELNFTNDSVLFIDDNISERDRVKKSIKGINVPNWPTDPCMYKKTLSDLNCFDYGKQITKEDLNRTKYYQENSKRVKIKENFLSEDKWLKSLKTKVIFKKIDLSNITRVIQLIHRTNQMNLTTRRLNQKDIEALKKNKNNFLFSCEVKDKFGDMGIVGFFNLEVKNKIGIVKDFLLSCRAFGRGIELAMIFKMSKILKTKKCSKLVLNYEKTKKNKPGLMFLQKNFKKQNKNIFSSKSIEKIKLPSYINIK